MPHRSLLPVILLTISFTAASVSAQTPFRRVAVERQTSYDGTNPWSDVRGADFSMDPSGNVTFMARTGQRTHIWSEATQAALVSSGDPVPGRPGFTFSILLSGKIGRVHDNGVFLVETTVRDDTGRDRAALFLHRAEAFEEVMIEGQPRPDGETFGVPGGYAANRQGDAVFTDDPAIPNSPTRTWLLSEGNLEELAAEGEAVPGVPDATWAPGFLHPRSLTASGEVVYIGYYTVVGDPPGQTRTGIFRHRLGVTTPFLLPTDDGTTRRSPLWVMPVLADEAVLFAVDVRPSDTNDDVVNEFRRLNVVTSANDLVFASDQFPGEALAAPVTFNAQPCGRDARIWAEASGIDGSRIWVLEGSDGTFRTVATRGGPAPGAEGATFSSLGLGTPATCSDMGDAVFFQFLEGTGVTGTNNNGLWIARRGGEVELVARAGDALGIAEGMSQPASFFEYPADVISAQSRTVTDSGLVGAWVAFSDPAQIQSIFVFGEAGAAADPVDLAIRLEPQTAAEGELRLRVVVQNNSSADASNVRVTVVPPDGVTLVDNLGAPIVPMACVTVDTGNDNFRFDCDLQGLQAQTERSFDIRLARAEATSPFTFTAEVSSNERDSNPVDNQTELALGGEADLTMTLDRQSSFIRGFGDASDRYSLVALEQINFKFDCDFENVGPQVSSSAILRVSVAVPPVEAMAEAPFPTVDTDPIGQIAYVDLTVGGRTDRCGSEASGFTCPVGDLQPGEAGRISIAVTELFKPTLYRASIDSSSTPDPDATNNACSVILIPEVARENVFDEVNERSSGCSSTRPLRDAPLPSGWLAVLIGGLGQRRMRRRGR